MEPETNEREERDWPSLGQQPEEPAPATAPETIVATDSDAVPEPAATPETEGEPVRVKPWQVALAAREAAGEAAGEGSVPVPPASADFSVQTWAGRPNWCCAHCNFATLNGEAAIRQHLWIRHQIGERPEPRVRGTVLLDSTGRAL